MECMDCIVDVVSVEFTYVSGMLCSQITPFHEFFDQRCCICFCFDVNVNIEIAENSSLLSRLRLITEHLPP